VRQNKWRASRFGNRAQLVNSYTHEVLSVSDVVGRLIERLRPTAKELDCVDYLEAVQGLADQPSAADAQKNVLDETGKSAEIVRRMIARSRISPAPAPVVGRGASPR
jgi:carboxylate-amine ligase